MKSFKFLFDKGKICAKICCDMKKDGRIYIIILLILISATAVTRIVGFNSPHSFTFDEVLYPQLALQLKENPLNYTSQPTYKYYISQGRSLPDYLNRPLFKHPPLYPYLISLTYYVITNPTLRTAWSISFFSGVSLMLLIYLLGKTLYGQKVGLLAAFLLFLDPIHWLCTQKIWMETTITAFIWISLFFIIKAAKESKPKYFYWAGLATGCAILTKYTGFLIFPIGLTVIYIYNRTALKSKHFWAWPLISMTSFMPWLLWNYKIYKSDFLAEIFNAHHRIKPLLFRLSDNWHLWILALSVGVIATLLLKRAKKTLSPLVSAKVRAILLSLALLLLFVQPYMMRGLINMFVLTHIPTNGWIIGMFKHQPWYFYLRRLLALSPFYIFSFASILFLINSKKSEKALIAMSIWILASFILWGNYQCRYILSAAPALLLLSSRAIIWTGTKLKESSGPKMHLLFYRIAFVSVLLFFLVKVIFIDLFLALPNKTCYF